MDTTKSKILIERTAKSPFTLDGAPVRAGQIVALTTTQKRKLVRAGCVADSDEDNAEVPVAELPPTQETAPLLLGDKNQVVELNEAEFDRMKGLDPALPDLVREARYAEITDEQWQKLAGLDSVLEANLRAHMAALAAHQAPVQTAA